MTDLWDQLPGESSKAYAAFVIYRDLGPRRSIEEASRLYHDRPNSSPRRRRASGQIRHWAERWNWPARAVAWDQSLEVAKRDKQIEAAQEMAERHAREAMLLQNKAVERLRQLRPEELKPRDTLSFLIEAAKLERLSHGEPTEHVAEDHRFPDVQELSDAELARIVSNGRGLLLPGSRGTATEKDGQDEPS